MSDIKYKKKSLRQFFLAQIFFPKVDALLHMGQNSEALVLAQAAVEEVLASIVLSATLSLYLSTIHALL